MSLFQGEEAVRKAHRHEDLACYIVRPGRLLNNVGGVQGLTIEQGKSLILRPPLLQQTTKKLS
jgi:hypothetical protein